MQENDSSRSKPSIYALLGEFRWCLRHASCSFPGETRNHAVLFRNSPDLLYLGRRAHLHTEKMTRLQIHKSVEASPVWYYRIASSAFITPSLRLSLCCAPTFASASTHLLFINTLDFRFASLSVSISRHEVLNRVYRCPGRRSQRSAPPAVQLAIRPSLYSWPWWQ
jgi:hypothetical protein